MSLVYFHLAATLIFTPLEEIYNLNNPSYKPNRQFILCNWKPDDFHHISNRQWVLKTYGTNDGYFKNKARKKFYNK